MKATVDTTRRELIRGLGAAAAVVAAGGSALRTVQASDEGPLVFGKGDQTMDFIHIADCARANLLALESDVTGECFNVATGKETSLLELCTMMLELMGKPDLKPEHGPERKTNVVQRRRGGTEKAKKMLGFESKVACDGEEAVALYREAAAAGRPFAAVILDLTVPGAMGGIECLRRLRAFDAGVRALVSTGYASDLVMSAHEEYGFCAVVPKPYRLADLSNALALALPLE